MDIGFKGVGGAEYAAFGDARKAMALGIAQLGAQVREDIARIQTNKDIAALGQEAANLDPTSDTFPQQMVGVLSRHPLAAQTPVGVSAINTLGAAHKNYLAAKDKVQNLYAPVPGAPGYTYDRRTGAVREPDVEMPQKPQRPFGINATTEAVYDPATGEVKTREELGLPAMRARSGANGASFEAEQKYNEFAPAVDELRYVRKKITGLGLDPEVDHETLVKKFGNPGAVLSQRRAAAQARLRGGKGKDSGRMGVPQAESYVDSYRSKYGIDELGVNAMRPQGPPPSQAPTPDDLPLFGDNTLPVKLKAPDRTVAAEALKRAGGDRAKAKQLLRESGYAVD